MTSRPSRFPYARGAALAAIAALATLVACESKLPTSAEIERMDLSAAEHSAREAAFVGALGDSTALYLVDGARVTAEQAHMLPSEKIATIEIRKAAAGDKNIVLIDTKIARAAAGDTGERVTIRLLGSSANELVDVERAETPSTERRRETSTTFEARLPAPPEASKAPVTPDENRFSGLIYIDGVRSDRAAMRALKPEQIESVEVIKAERAKALYSEPEAANGVIKITTRRAQ